MSTRKTQRIKAKVDEKPDLYAHKVVTALNHFLAESSMDDLLDFLRDLHVQFTLTVTNKGHYSFRIFQLITNGGSAENRFSYDGAHPNNPRYAIVSALAKFLIFQNGDFHDFILGDWPDMEAHRQKMAKTQPSKKAQREKTAVTSLAPAMLEALHTMGPEK